MKLHLFAYILGWLYYTVTPVIIVYYNIFPEITQNLNVPFWFVLSSALMFFSFAAGSISAQYVRVTQLRMFNFPLKQQLYGSLIIILFFIFFVFYLDDIQVGYGGEADNKTGVLSTFMIVLCYYYMHFFLRYHFQSLCSIHLSIILAISVTFCGLLLVLSGGRLYLLTALLWIIFARLDLNYLKKRTVLILLTLIISISILVGQWRLGDDISADNFMFYAFAEPLLLFFAIDDYFTLNEIQMLNYNPDILMSLINLVPSIIFPMKEQFYNTLSVQGVVNSPFGGLHVVISMLENFGLIGSLLISYLVGFIIMKTYIVGQRNYTFLNLYYFLCAYSVFLYNREAFSTQHKILLVVLICSVLQNKWIKKYV